ncbi:hypothetical protein L596_028376 [Steinernema carpocapsae]|uniref:Uncharacterized protein n=1 Tax=Steinernema carpocapsae TaxID=34508 RepID=A0A4U5LY94_STECR|nr:hypothetical protein L596_028376 [Steinernema carpocapsae]
MNGIVPFFLLVISLAVATASDSRVKLLVRDKKTITRIDLDIRKNTINNAVVVHNEISENFPILIAADVEKVSFWSNLGVKEVVQRFTVVECDFRRFILRQNQLSASLVKHYRAKVVFCTFRLNAMFKLMRDSDTVFKLVSLSPRLSPAETAVNTRLNTSGDCRPATPFVCRRAVAGFSNPFVNFGDNLGEIG